MIKKKIISFLLIGTLLFSTTVAYAQSTLFSKYTNGNYKHATKFDNCLILDGIDVSQWNQDINWKKVKADGIDYVIIRIGGRGYGESGRLYFDDYAKDYIKGAKSAGLMIGGYFFSQAITEKEAIKEADYTIQILSQYNLDSSDFDLPIFMDREFASDSEDPGRLVTAKLTKAKETKIEMAFCNRLSELGFNSGLYAGYYYLKDNTNSQELIDAGHTVWEAQYNDECNFKGDYSLWQYTSDGKVDGINTRTDCNFWYLNKSLEAAENAGTSIEGFTATANDVVSNGSGPYTPNIVIKHIEEKSFPTEDSTEKEITNTNEPTKTVLDENTPEEPVLNETEIIETILEDGKDYKIIGYIDNNKIGLAYAIIKGIGQYTGYRAIPYNIILKGGLESDTYTVGEYITGINAETLAGDVLKEFSTDEGFTIKLLDTENKEVSGKKLVGTGMHLAIYTENNKLVGKIPIVVSGDVNGDGYIRATDYMKIKNHIMGVGEKLKDEYYKSADVNGDSYIKATDYMKIKNHIMGIAPIK